MKPLVRASRQALLLRQTLETIQGESTWRDWSWPPK